MSSASLALTLVNQSSDTNNSTVLIFQKSTLAGLGETAVAWHVIQNLGRGWTHPFVYEFGLQVGTSDSYGNSSPLLPAAPGQLFSDFKNSSGDQIKLDGDMPNNTSDIWVQNDLGIGAADACVYRSGKLLAKKTGVVPGQAAAFQFNASIYIGVISQWDVKPGQLLNSGILSTVNSQVSLAGLSGSANIVMSGGGPGPSAVSFKFDLIPTG